MSETHITLELVPGSIAPRYPDEVANQRHLQLEKVIITEKGMTSGLPLIDFQCVDKDGKQFFFAISGRLVNMVSAAIKAVNTRNHGCEEP